MNGKSGRKELTREAILATVEAGAKSMTDVVRGLGYKSVCGATTKKIKAACPDIGERLKAAKNGTDGGTKEKTEVQTAAKKEVATAEGEGKQKKADSKGAAKAKAQPKANGQYPRAASNPFRDGSAYATGYDILSAAGDDGMERSKLVEEMARVTGKPVQKAYFDATVVLSSRPGPENGGDGGSHRCIAKAADVYWVEKRNGWVKLHLRDRKY